MFALSSRWRRRCRTLFAAAFIGTISGCGWPGQPPPIKAFLPYVEEVELPSKIDSFQPFTMRIKVSAPGKASLLKNSLLSLDGVNTTSNGVLRLDAAINLERGVPISPDGWCEVTVSYPPVHFAEYPKDEELITVEVLSADRPENGGLQGLLYWDGPAKFSHGYLYQQYSCTYIPYIPPQN